MNQMVDFQLSHSPTYTLPIDTIYLDNNSRSHFSPFKDTFRIQTIIFLHALPAIGCLIIQMLLMMLGYQHQVMGTPGICIIAYTFCFLIYFLLLNIIYPTQSFFRRLFKELFFVALKLSTCMLLLFLTVDLAHWNFFVMVPISVLLSTSLNVLFSWLFRKMFPSF